MAESASSTPDHWRRFRRLMLIMLGITIVAVGLSIAWLVGVGAPMRLHFLIAVGLGVTFSLLLTGALMGLVFVSARSGHDEAAYSQPPGDEPPASR